MSSIDPGRTALLPDEALRLVLDALPPVLTETAGLRDCLGRSLPVAIPNLIDQPPFDKSGMDGFAYCPPPLPRPGAGAVYRVSRTLAAGIRDGGSILPGECARIMTGAPVPSGAAAVQRVEWTSPVLPAEVFFATGDENRDSAIGTFGATHAIDAIGIAGNEFVRFDRPETADNIVMRGENLKAGESLLTPRILEAQDIGILASSGYFEVPVARRPVVGILSTGDEIVAPGAALPSGSIYDSNGPQLSAQVLASGCMARSYGIVRDDEGPLLDALGTALAECDVVIVSGGVSMGDFDFVPSAFAKLGVEKVFHGLAMRPGKPTFYGRKGDKSVFGMPGNPVSTFVNFEVLVRSHLNARMGIAYTPRILRARLSAPLVRRGSDRVEFLPALLAAAPDGDGMTVSKLAYHGSSMLSVLSRADCLVRMDMGVERMEEGEVVDVRLLRA
ncbi:MAG: molybdopterin molybdotransferase MoeA [Rectinemataceae bacterium]|nr:molybdopterin molybdotransferase MoeA [Rectinemataceae bacterium]